MSLAILYSRAQEGIQAPLVTVEVHLSNGLPGLSIVGLPEMAVRESKDRVRGALINSQFEFPARRITINLAPADLPKEGGRFDLPIALGILAASNQLAADPLNHYEFTGELALSGEMRPINGILPVALTARDAGRSLILPQQNAEEAGLVSGLQCYPAKHLLEVCSHINSVNQLEQFKSVRSPANATTKHQLDMADVYGQSHARRALEISAAGAHSLLYIGPPGTGKSMLASRLPGILPPMSEEEALECAAIHSVANNRAFQPAQWRQRPYRAPHHTASAAALVGGGSNPKPGEISLAHCGVLFLDELPEFDRHTLEVLREPLENGRITISRANRQVDYPSRFQMIAAMNPCPCGHLGDGSNRCHCTLDRITRYRNRISGPLLDRIDMHVEVPRQPLQINQESPTLEEPSEAIRRRVIEAREIQLQRQGCTNQALQGLQIEQVANPGKEGNALLHRAIEKLGLSMRAYHRILKVARTIADLEGSPKVETAHISEAIGYRRLDRR
ncbi:MAG: YifB family Mg chelatase-like AAA ATPase [Candidatus Thiodiazotropha sp.]